MSSRRNHLWLSPFAALALLIMLAGCGGSSGQSTNNGGSSNGNSSGCKAGTEKIDGVTTRNFCGPAKAKATVNGQEKTWSNGECTSTSTNYAVNIGRIILGSDDKAKALKKQYDYFGIAILEAPKAGTFTSAAVAGEIGGDSIALINSEVTLNADLKGGTFTGKQVGQDTIITGSWTC